MKKHKIKQERPDGSSRHRGEKERQTDLVYFIHDRVELLQQVFSLVKPKEIKAMIPDCVRDISQDDLKELCLEELLGISSKRLLSTLHGAAPPSDTESSSDDSDRRGGAENLDTISLDSISSDEGALSTEHTSEKSKKRCKRRDKRKKSSKSKREKKPSGGGGERERAAERAGLTVLELLELQARARAIKAQLNADTERKNAAASATATTAEGVVSTSEDDVEIKEEPAEVVELVSSDSEADTKLGLAGLSADGPKQAAQPKPEPQPAEVSRTEDDTRIVIKRADLTITVPKAQTTRKIKLNRQKSIAVAGPKSTENDASSRSVIESTAQDKTDKASETKAAPVELQEPPKKKDRVKKKKKTKRPKNNEGSDQDEITLQLSDSEKMDLLEDFDRKNYDELSSSSSEEDGEGTSDRSENSRIEAIAPDDTSGKPDNSTHDQQTKESNIESRQTNKELSVEDNTSQISIEINENDHEMTLVYVDKGVESPEKPISEAAMTIADDDKGKNGKESPEKPISEAEINIENTEKIISEVKEKSTETENTDEGSANTLLNLDNTENATITVEDEVQETCTEEVNIIACDTTSVEGEDNGNKSIDNQVTETEDYQEVELSETAEVVSSEVDTTAKKIDTSETSKKPKVKKKSKKEKKSKKDKQSKD